MGLLTQIRKNQRKARETRILMLGLDNSGKTTTLKRIVGENVREVAPTLGFNIKTVVHRGLTVNIWDVGGQKSLRPYWRNYFERTDAMIWVVDSTDILRMSDCRAELHDLLKEERLQSSSLLVFANKQDVGGALSIDDIREALSLDAIKTHTWHIQSCSALTGENVLEGLDWVVAEIGHRLYYSLVSLSSDTLLDRPPAPGLQAFATTPEATSPAG
jgi:ADP-ribosylation factor-like protein 2